MAPNTPDGPHWLRSNTAKLAILAASIPVIGGIVTAFVQGWFTNDKPDPKPTPTPAPVTSSATTTTLPTGDPSTTPTTPSQVQYLSDLEPLDGGNDVHVSTVIEHGVQRTFQHSLRSGEIGSLEEYTYEYNIVGGFQMFCATVGVDYKAESGTLIGFQVYLDGQSKKDYQATDITTQNVAIPISGYSKIKLMAKVVKSQSYVNAVWGEARFANKC